MPGTRSTFGAHQIVVAADLVEMGPFNPDGMLLHMGTAPYNLDGLAHGAVAFHVVAQQPDGPLSFVFGLAHDGGVVHNPSVALFVEAY